MPQPAAALRQHDSYTVAFICALNFEMSAVRYQLDCEHPNLPPQPGDSNLYVLGELLGHNVVLAWLSGRQGKGAAAIVATNMNRSFPAIKWRFLVGIAGGIPSPKHDIRLGDVVVGIPRGQHGGVVQYDLGKDHEDNFEIKGFLVPPPTELLGGIELMQSNHVIENNKIEDFLVEMLQRGPRLCIYRRPAEEEDILFDMDYPHPRDANQSTCEGCDRQKTVSRPPRHVPGPEIHYGLIASGDRVMKSGAKRQAAASMAGDILCFEMEAAGIATEFGCVVIRGISDYADSHKNDAWQHYAAATAAATAKELLSCMPQGPEQGDKAADLMVEEDRPSQLLDTEDCLKSLAFEEMNIRINDVNIVAANGTCQWLLNHPTCAEWSAQHRALLWIKGKPGSGKSTLARYILDAVKETAKVGDEVLILSFFFHGRGAELQKTPFGLFRSLLHQLISRFPDAAPDLVALFHLRNSTIGKHGDRWHWQLREIQDAFQHALANILRRRSVWLFVDALDECGKQNAVALVSHFKSLLDLLPSTSLQFLICFTCRHYPMLSPASAYEITLENENEQDISQHVEKQLSVLDTRAASLIRDLITAQASGVFMWAALVAEKVLELDREGASVKRIEMEIRATPPGLFNLYLGLVQGMSERSASLQIIKWICFATRPLFLNELRWALVIDSDRKSSIKSLKEAEESEDYIEDSNRMARRLKALSCGLAEAVPFGDAQMVVQFIHQSVRDFFIEKGIAALNGNLDLSKAAVGQIIGTAHHQLCRTCVRYIIMADMTQDISPGWEPFASCFPLLSYAAGSWIEHATTSESHGVSQEELLFHFNWPSTELLRIKLAHMGMMMFYSPPIPEHLLEVYNATTTMLHLVAEYGLLTPFQFILSYRTRMDIALNERGHRGETPLFKAAKNGHDSIALLLLDLEPVEIDAKNNCDQTPLFAASGGGNTRMVRMLIEKGADVNSEDCYGETPLTEAAAYGDAEAVEMLLHNGANVEGALSHRKTPLHRAAKCGHAKVVQILLQSGGDMEAADDARKVPLHLACEEDHPDVVDALLQYGANHEAVDSNGRTPLHSALCSAGVATAQALLRMGADLGARDARGQTPLILGVSSPHARKSEAINAIIVWCKADPTRLQSFDVGDDDGWTAAYTAASYKLESMEAELHGLSVIGSRPSTLRLERPTGWHRKDKSDSLHVSDCGTVVTTLYQTEDGIAVVRANHAMPANGLFYFEIEVLRIEDSFNGAIGVGFCECHNSLDRMAGWEVGSWGYHGDDGRRFNGQNMGSPYGPTYADGDVVGCGIDFDRGLAFFTKNGQYLGELRRVGAAAITWMTANGFTTIRAEQESHFQTSEASFTPQ